MDKTKLEVDFLICMLSLVKFVQMSPILPPAAGSLTGRDVLATSSCYWQLWWSCKSCTRVTQRKKSGMKWCFDVIEVLYKCRWEQETPVERAEGRERGDQVGAPAVLRVQARGNYVKWRQFVLTGGHANLTSTLGGIKCMEALKLYRFWIDLCFLGRLDYPRL